MSGPQQPTPEAAARIQAITELVASFRHGPQVDCIATVAKYTRDVPTQALQHIIGKIIRENQIMEYSANFSAIIHGQWKLMREGQERKRRAAEESRALRERPALTMERAQPEKVKALLKEMPFMKRGSGPPSAAELERRKREQIERLQRVNGEANA